MTEVKKYKASDYEDKSAYLVKERALMDDFADETRGALASVSHLVNDCTAQATGFSSSFYNSLTSHFDEEATTILSSTTDTIDTLSADHRTSEIAREEAYEEQRKEIQAEKEAEEVEKVDTEDDESKE